MRREEGPPDPEKRPVGVTKRELAVSLERKTCGGEWKQKPGLQWAGKSVGGEELELPLKEWTMP